MPVQERVAMSLYRLGSGNRLQKIGDLYGGHKSTFSKIMREFSRAIRKHLQHVFIQTPNESQLRILSLRFKQLYDMLHVIGVINNLHIIVSTPIFGGKKLLL